MRNATARMLMTPEGIPLANKGRILAYLHSVFGNARQWTATADDLKAAAAKAERELSRYQLPPASRDGATAYHRTPGPSSKAYGYRFVVGSVSVLRREGGEWRLIAAERCGRAPRDPDEVKIHLTHEQEARCAAVWATRIGEREDHGED